MDTHLNASEERLHPQRKIHEAKYHEVNVDVPQVLSELVAGFKYWLNLLHCDLFLFLRCHFSNICTYKLLSEVNRRNPSHVPDEA